MLLSQLIHLRLREIADLKYRILGVLISAFGLLAVLSRLWLPAIQNALIEGHPQRYETVLTSIFGSIFVMWVASGTLANFHLGWHFDLRKVFRTPFRPFKVYAVKTVCGLLGPWLLAVLPLMIASSWYTVGPLGTVVMGLGFLLFAVCANSATSIAMLLIGPLFGRIVRTTFVLMVSLAVSLVALGSVRAVVMHDHGVLTRFSHLLAQMNIRWVEYLPAGSSLAGSLRALRDHDYTSALFFCSILLAFTMTLGLVEYMMLRRVYVAGKPLLKPQGSGTQGLLPLWVIVFRYVPEPERSKACLLLREVQRLREIPSVTVLTLLNLCYCSVFVVFVPPQNVLILDIICMLPFLAFVGYKGNLLGPDWASAKMIFTQPAGLMRLLRAKNMALDLCSGAILAATIITGTLAGTLHLIWWENLAGLCYLVALFQVWDMLGSYCSIMFPQPVNRDRRAPIDAWAAPFLMLLGPPIVLVPFAALELVGLKSGHLPIVLVGCTAFSLFVTAFNRIVFRTWLKGALIARHESMYMALNRPDAL